MESSNKIVFLLLFSSFVDVFVSANPENNTVTMSTVMREIPNCAIKPCIAKCCPEKQMVLLGWDRSKRERIKKCTNSVINSSFDEINVFNEDLNVINKSVKEIFNVVDPDVLKMTNFTSALPGNRLLYNLYLVDDGTLVLEVPNRWPSLRWSSYNNTSFCVDYVKLSVKSATTAIAPRYFIIPKTSVHAPPPKNYHLSAAMLVSCVFLALVLLVYGLLPELRNLRGLVLMAYVASLLAGFAIFTVLNLLSNFGKASYIICKCFSFAVYFSLLSSFFWMNVMSLDIWWTFRGFAKVRQIHRRGEWFKFLVYCAYAWGIPSLMTTVLIVLNETDMRHLPWFVTPQIPNAGCFISDYSRLLYLYLPMLIILVMNLIFFIMTVFNMWRMSRGHAVLSRAAVAAGTPSAHLSNRNRFMVYLKLSAVMGVNWLLEVISSFYPELLFWNVTDIYNMITGIIVFLIFVWKKKIWRMLIKRYAHEGSRSRWFSHTSNTQDLHTSTSDIEISQEMPLQCVSYNTRGE